MRFVSRATVVCVLVAAALWCGTGAATAEQPAESGWWWAGRPTGAVPGVAPAPTVPEGGLYVETGPAGASGISALRFFLGEALADTLTLDVDDASGPVAVDACVAADAWQPAEGGSWDERPAADCDTARVAGEVAADAATVSFDVASLQDGGVLDIVLVPRTAADPRLPSTFAVSFRPPGPDALAVTEPVGAERTDPTLPGRRPSSSPPTGTRARQAVRPSAGANVFVSPPVTAVDRATARRSSETAPRSSAEVLRRPQAPPAVRDEATGDFSHPAVHVLPLLFLACSCYLGRALTQPVDVGLWPFRRQPAA